MEGLHLLLLMCFFSFHLPSSILATNESNMFALLSFKPLISNGPFGALSSWNDSLHYCEWQGVMCGNRHPDRVNTKYADHCFFLIPKFAAFTIDHFHVSCSSTDHHGNDFKALIFELMPNGSLEAWLHPNPCPNRPFRSLSLIQRMNIVIDVATALDYLHNHGPAPILHCDLEPSNVLLDDDMTAHVGDFGLARFLVQPDSTSSLLTGSSVGLRGSIGYIPPEYGMGGQASIEGDAYSYGILVLEMFTGISPTDERSRNGLNLHKHVEMAFSDRASEIIDHRLFPVNDGEENANAEVIHDFLGSVIQLGLLCSKLSPKDRIGIEEVVKELNWARMKLLR